MQAGVWWHSLAQPKAKTQVPSIGHYLYLAWMSIKRRWNTLHDWSVNYLAAMKSSSTWHNPKRKPKWHTLETIYMWQAPKPCNDLYSMIWFDLIWFDFILFYFIYRYGECGETCRMRMLDQESEIQRLRQESRDKDDHLRELEKKTEVWMLTLFLDTHLLVVILATLTKRSQRTSMLLDSG